MSWSDRTVIAILLLVARIIAGEPELAAEIKTLANHIAVNTPRVDA